MKKQLITIAILTAAVSLTGCTVNINDETMSAAKDIAASVLDDTDVKVNGQSVNVSLDSDGNISVSAGQKAAATPGADLFGGYVIGDTAVKSQPDPNSETLITIPDATQIGVKESGVSGWFMTVFQDQTGYIAAQSVKDIPPYDPALGGDNVLGGSVNADVKLMSGTHPYAEVLIEIPSGTQVNYYVLASDSNWCVVSYQGKAGYVENKYIKAIEDYNMADGSSAGQHSGDDFLGTWSAGRIYVTIEKSGEGYEAAVKWSSSAAESTNWTYSCEFNGEYLDSTNGRCVNSIYEENGNVSETVRYTNGCAHFRLNGNGNLIWEDLRDNTVGGDTELMKIS